MSKYSVKKTNAFLVFMALILLVGGIGIIYRFTNGFKSDFKTFYVKQGDNEINSAVSNYAVKFDEEMRFDVKYAFDYFSDTPKGYTVKIVPNVSNNNDFDFTVDGLVYSFGAEPDLTRAFDLKIYDDYFILKLDDGIGMANILKRIYPGQEVIVPSINTQADYFKIIITSYDNSAKIEIGFNIVSVASISLSETNIIF